MAEKTITILTGKIERDVFGSWDDCDTGLYIDTDMLDTIFNRFRGKTLRITIEEIQEERKK